MCVRMRVCVCVTVSVCVHVCVRVCVCVCVFPVQVREQRSGNCFLNSHLRVIARHCYGFFSGQELPIL